MSRGAATPTLEQVIKDAIEGRLVDVNTAMPARVKKVDIAKQIVDVEPCLMRKYSDGAVVPLPVITNVPLVFQRTATGGLFFPIKAGDYVLLVFSQRSIDIWEEKGGIVDPKDPRKFNLSDAIAVPGLFPKGSAYARADAAFARLEWGDASIELQPSGKFRIQKIGGEELFDLVSQLSQEVIDLSAAVAALAAAVASLAGNAGTIGSTAAGSGLFSVGETIALTAAAAGASADGGAASSAGSDASSVGTDAGTIKGKVDGLKG